MAIISRIQAPAGHLPSIPEATSPDLLPSDRRSSVVSVDSFDGTFDALDDIESADENAGRQDPEQAEVEEQSIVVEPDDPAAVEPRDQHVPASDEQPARERVVEEQPAKERAAKKDHAASSDAPHTRSGWGFIQEQVSDPVPGYEEHAPPSYITAAPVVPTAPTATPNGERACQCPRSGFGWRPCGCAQPRLLNPHAPAYRPPPGRPGTRSTPAVPHLPPRKHPIGAFTPRRYGQQLHPTAPAPNTVRPASVRPPPSRPFPSASQPPRPTGHAGVRRGTRRKGPILAAVRTERPRASPQYPGPFYGGVPTPGGGTPYLDSFLAGLPLPSPVQPPRAPSALPGLSREPRPRPSLRALGLGRGHGNGLRPRSSPTSNIPSSAWPHLSALRADLPGLTDETDFRLRVPGPVSGRDNGATSRPPIYAPRAAAQSRNGVIRQVGFLPLLADAPARGRRARSRGHQPNGRVAQPQAPTPNGNSVSAGRPPTASAGLAHHLNGASAGPAPHLNGASTGPASHINGASGPAPHINGVNGYSVRPRPSLPSERRNGRAASPQPPEANGHGQGNGSGGPPALPRLIPPLLSASDDASTPPAAPGLNGANAGGVRRLGEPSFGSAPPGDDGDGSNSAAGSAMSRTSNGGGPQPFATNGNGSNGDHNGSSSSPPAAPSFLPPAAPSARAPAPSSHHVPAADTKAPEAGVPRPLSPVSVDGPIGARSPAPDLGQVPAAPVPPPAPAPAPSPDPFERFDVPPEPPGPPGLQGANEALARLGLAPIGHDVEEPFCIWAEVDALLASLLAWYAQRRRCFWSTVHRLARMRHVLRFQGMVAAVGIVLPTPSLCCQLGVMGLSWHIVMEVRSVLSERAMDLLALWHGIWFILAVVLFCGAAYVRHRGGWADDESMLLYLEWKYLGIGPDVTMTLFAPRSSGEYDAASMLIWRSRSGGQAGSQSKM